jgi:hypothetical protein
MPITNRPGTSPLTDAVAAEITSVSDVTVTYLGLVRYIVTLESMRPRPGPVLRAL